MAAPSHPAPRPSTAGHRHGERLSRPTCRPRDASSPPGASGTVEACCGTDVAAEARTDAVGHYELSLQPGTYVIAAKARGYLSIWPPRTVSVSAGQTPAVSFVLSTIPRIL
jgi:hypothetical protein